MGRLDETMTTRDLHPLLDPLLDTREVVVRRVVAGDLLPAVWRLAADEAQAAYAAWCSAPGRLTHATYLAAEDRADAALESLQAAAPVALAA